MWRTDALTPTPNLHISGKKNASRLIAPALAVIAKPVPHSPLPDKRPQPPLHLGPPPRKRPTASDARRAGCCRPRRKVVTRIQPAAPAAQHSRFGPGRAMAQNRGRGKCQGPGQVPGAGASARGPGPVAAGAGASCGRRAWARGDRPALSVAELAQPLGDLGTDPTDIKNLVSAGRPSAQQDRSPPDTERFGQGTARCLGGPPVHRWCRHRDDQSRAMRTQVAAPYSGPRRSRFDPDRDSQRVTAVGGWRLSLRDRHRHRRWRSALPHSTRRRPGRSGHKG